MTRRGLAAAMALFALAVLTGRAQSPARGGSHVIAGVIESAANGQPLSGANVTLQDTTDFQTLAVSTSDENGRFAFSNVPDGKFILIASHRGYVPSAYEEHDGPLTAIVTGEGQTTTGIVLTLPPLGGIFGRIGEDSGDPVPHARVLLYRRARFNGIERVQRSGQTMADAMGNFEFPQLGPGTYYLCASGEPWYRVIPDRGGPRAVKSSQSAALDVAYPLSCYPDTQDPTGAESIAVRAGDRVQADVTMHALPALHIFLQVPRGDPQSGFPMPQLRQDVFGISEPANAGSIFTQDGSGGQGAGQGTDQGTVTVEIVGITAGQYNLQLQQQNSSESQSRFGNIAVASSDVSMDVSSLAPMASVSGTLTVAGASQVPTNCSVYLTSGQGDSGGFAKVAADGSFRIPSVQPGAYEVMVNTGNMTLPVTQIKASGKILSDSLLNVGTAPIQIEVAAVNASTSVAGMVTRGGKPASGVFALLVPVKLNGSRYTWQPNQSDSDGSVTFDRVAPGTYTVVAIEQGWTLDWRRPEVISQYLAGGVRVTVSPGAKKVEMNAPVETQSIKGTRD